MIDTLRHIITLAAVDPAATWRPFLDPIDLHGHWLWLIAPLLMGVALVYKTLKAPSLREVPLETLRLGIYILVLMAVAGATLWGVIELV
ncbi:MAG: hypothetical protein GC159_14530 [Phycisphaera sp.]|nr:hypothetical protein [Phycisphaera sp.]